MDKNAVIALLRGNREVGETEQIKYVAFDGNIVIEDSMGFFRKVMGVTYDVGAGDLVVSTTNERGKQMRLFDFDLLTDEEQRRILDHPIWNCMTSKVFARLMELAIADRKRGNQMVGRMVEGESVEDVTSDDLFREFVGEYLVSFNNDLTDEEQYRLIDIFAARCGWDAGEYDAFHFPFEAMLENYDSCVTILERSKRMEAGDDNE